MLMNSNEYLNIVESIKQEIRTAQYRATVSVNRELLVLYHSIGEVINEHKTWGNKFVENLAADIKISFPDATGYSVRNLKYMAKFALRFPDKEIVQAALAQITWYHHIALMDKVKSADEHIWYAEQVAKNGWSRNVLVHQIESGLYQRQVLAEKVSNFESRLPSPQSELAAQTMKDPYIFDFIPFKEDMVERDIEQALVKDVTKLLLELGTGFAFLGNQYHLNVGGDDFYIDLLFYNLNLRCYVVIELKTGEFKPEYAGQLIQKSLADIEERKTLADAAADIPTRQIFEKMIRDRIFRFQLLLPLHKGAHIRADTEDGEPAVLSSDDLSFVHCPEP